jgi:hypothetical protein
VTDVGLASVSTVRLNAGVEQVGLDATPQSECFTVEAPEVPPAVADCFPEESIDLRAIGH